MGTALSSDFLCVHLIVNNIRHRFAGKQIDYMNVVKFNIKSVKINKI